jgi:hypothetical protein
VVPLLNAVAKAQRVARQRLSECGFDDQVGSLFRIDYDFFFRLPMPMHRL